MLDGLLLALGGEKLRGELVAGGDAEGLQIRPRSLLAGGAGDALGLDLRGSVGTRDEYPFTGRG